MAADRSPPPPPPQLSEPRVGFQPRRGQAAPATNRKEESLPCYWASLGHGQWESGRGRKGGGGAARESRRRVLALTKVTPALNYLPNSSNFGQSCAVPVQESCGEDNRTPPPPSPPTSYPRAPPPPLQTSTLLVIFFSRWRLLTMQKSHVTSLLLSLLCAGLTGKLKWTGGQLCLSL